MFDELRAQWFSNIAVAGLSFILTITIARTIGPNNFGEYAYALSIGSILAIFIDGGMKSITFRERTAPTHSLQYLANSLPGLALSHVIGMSLVMTLVLVLILDGSYVYLAIATIGCFAMTVATQIVSAMLRGDGRIKSDAWFLLGSRSAIFVGVLMVVVIGGRSPWQILAAWAVAGFIFLLFFHDVWQKPRLIGLYTLYRAALPFIIFELSITLYIRSDILVLSYLGVRQDEIGQFSAAFRVCEACILMASPIGILFFRKIRGADRPLTSKKLMALRALRLSFFVSTPVVMLIGYLAPLIVDILFGANYKDAGDNLRILSGMLLFVLPNIILNQSAVALGKEKVSMLAAAFAAVVNIGSLFLFVPTFGVFGAAWIKVATEGFVCTLMAISLILSIPKDQSH